MPRRSTLLSLLPLLIPISVSGQDWNAPAAVRLAERGIARRIADPARGLADFRARAHGFVFFLAQLGAEQLEEPPHLVKSDQLELEVYWKTPDASKQRIIGWRDRVDLPTDIAYHRDHLGIVQNGFADRIRLGEGDEVRDVPHPLAPDGPALYDYAFVDSTVIRLPDRVVRVHEVAFRPREPGAPRIIGSLFLDADTGELVRMRFNFTRAAYRDASLEDITIVLDNGLWESRYWLPRRQAIEIRRRTTWLELPARGIIRGRWEIDDYAFNVGLSDDLFLGPEIVAAPSAARDTFPWGQSLDEAIADVERGDEPLTLEQVRLRVRDLTGGRALNGLAPARPAVGALSDLARFNRVEGLRLGAGYVLRPTDRLALRAWAGWSFGPGRISARIAGTYEASPGVFRLEVERRVVDIGEEAVVAPLLGSLLAQEFGDDFGDHVLRDAAFLSFRRALSPSVTASLGAGIERTGSLPVRATPATGTFRPNPALGAGTVGVGRGRLGLTSGSGSARRQTGAAVSVEAGRGTDQRWLRVRGEARIRRPVAAAALEVAGWAGWASGETPGYRSFVVGGRGTLVGTPFRVWGGRRAAWGRVALRFGVPAPALPLGPFASTGRQAVLAPYVAAGWVDEPFAGMPWTASNGVQPVVGMTLEWFHRLLRVEFGWWPGGDRLGVVVDVRRDLWPIL